MALDTPTDPFSASEEAFFHAVPPPDDTSTSERPVTLEQEDFVSGPGQSSEREARRARFIRPVAVTLGALGALTLAGVARHAATARQNETALTRAATASGASVTLGDTSREPASVVTLPRQILVEATDEPATLFMSTTEQTTAPNSSTSTAAAAAVLVLSSESPEAPAEKLPIQDFGAPASGMRVKSPNSRPTSHGGRAAPITKAGLLRAVAASRPTHGKVQKTL